MPVKKVKGGYRWGSKGRCIRAKAGRLKRRDRDVLSEHQVGKANECKYY